MKKLFLILVLLLYSFSISAENYHKDINYCTWMGNVANVIAKNRDLGINQFDLINYYLQQNSDYDEQMIVITLIDEIYVQQIDIDADMVALQTETTCMTRLLSKLN